MNTQRERRARKGRVDVNKSACEWIRSGVLVCWLVCASHDSRATAAVATAVAASVVYARFSFWNSAPTSFNFRNRLPHIIFLPQLYKLLMFEERNIGIYLFVPFIDETEKKTRISHMTKKYIIILKWERDFLRAHDCGLWVTTDYLGAGICEISTV